MIIILRDYSSEDEYGKTMRNFDKVVTERGKLSHQQGLMFGTSMRGLIMRLSSTMKKLRLLLEMIPRGSSIDTFT